MHKLSKKICLNSSWIFSISKKSFDLHPLKFSISKKNPKYPSYKCQGNSIDNSCKWSYSTLQIRYWLRLPSQPSSDYLFESLSSSLIMHLEWFRIVDFSSLHFRMIGLLASTKTLFLGQQHKNDLDLLFNSSLLNSVSAYKWPRSRSLCTSGFFLSYQLDEASLNDRWEWWKDLSPSP